MVFFVVTLCRLVGGYQGFGGMSISRVGVIGVSMQPNYGGQVTCIVLIQNYGRGREDRVLSKPIGSEKLPFHFKEKSGRVTRVMGT
jgi:hypothetical protein